MYKKTLYLLALFTLLISCSPSKTGNKKVADLNTYLSTISIESLRTNLTYIASDETEGRETGSEGQKKAGKFIIDFYKKNGISFPQEENRTGRLLCHSTLTRSPFSFRWKITASGIFAKRFSSAG